MYFLKSHFMPIDPFFGGRGFNMQLKTLSLKFNGARVLIDDGKSFEAWKSHTEECYFCVHACVSVLCIYFSFLCVNGKELVLWGTAVLIARPGVFSQAHTSVLALAPLTFSWNEEGGRGVCGGGGGMLITPEVGKQQGHGFDMMTNSYVKSTFLLPFLLVARSFVHSGDGGRGGGLNGAFKRHTVSEKLWQRLFIAVFGVRPSVGRLLYWFDNLIARSSFFFFWYIMSREWLQGWISLTSRRTSGFRGELCRESERARPAAPLKIRHYWNPSVFRHSSKDCAF